METPGGGGYGAAEKQNVGGGYGAAEKQNVGGGYGKPGS